MAQIFRDEKGHEVFVTCWANVDRWGEPSGSLWAHGWCERCRAEVSAPDDGTQPDLFVREEVAGR